MDGPLATPPRKHQAPRSAEELERDRKALESLKIEVKRAYAADEYDTATKLLDEYDKLHEKVTGRRVRRLISPAKYFPVASPSEAASSGGGEGTGSGDRGGEVPTGDEQLDLPGMGENAHPNDGDASGPVDGDPPEEKEGDGFVMISDRRQRNSLILIEDDIEHMSFICDGLYLGDIVAAVDGERLAEASVTHVVDLANSVCDHHQFHGNAKNCHYVVTKDTGDWRDTAPTVVSKLVVKVDDVDDAPLDEHFDAMNDYITAAIAEGGNVLVHCFRGKSRSATTVISYLMSVKKMDLRSALRKTKDARPSIQLNVGFKKLLMDLERRLYPDQEPSIQLKLMSRKPVLSSMKRSTSKTRKGAGAGKVTSGAAGKNKRAQTAGEDAGGASKSTTTTGQGAAEVVKAPGDGDAGAAAAGAAGVGEASASNAENVKPPDEDAAT